MQKKLFDMLSSIDIVRNKKLEFKVFDFSKTNETDIFLAQDNFLICGHDKTS